MTLKHFAEANGINYQTAKTWLHRGKILEVSPGEFQINETWLKPETLVSTETPVSIPIPETLKRELESLKPETKVSIPAACAGCETLRRELETLRDQVRALEMWRVSHGTGPIDRAPSPMRPGGAIDPPGPTWGA